MAYFSNRYNVEQGFGDDYIVLVSGSTDANYYTARATSVDFEQRNSDAYQLYTIYYTLSLEWFNGSYWASQVLTSGYFNSNVTKKLSLSGVPAGNYRVKGYYRLDDKNPTYINVTNLFRVDR